MAISGKAYAFTVSVIGILGIIIGLLIGFLSTKAAYTKTNETLDKNLPKAYISRMLIDEMKPENIRENLR